MSFPPVDEQMELLRQGVVDLVSEEELEEKLEGSRESGEGLVVKVGFDPSAPDIHLGHTVVMRKMKQFQDLGHRVVFVVGDFTARIGDPSGRSKTRPALTAEEIRANAETYTRQAFKILDPERSETRFNSTWLEGLGAVGFIELASRYTVARMMEREDFRNRYESQQPIALHEFLYPLAQGYDSVALEADVEMGGTDQLFNLLVGRDLMREYDLEPQVAITMPLLVGTDGSQKMSKSLGNYIGIEDPPADMYGKVMSLSDETMWVYWRLCTDLTATEVEDLESRVGEGDLHPKEAKQRLARTIVADFWSEEEAEEAEREFEKVFAARGLPTDIEDVHIDSDEPVWIVQVIRECGFASSNSEARRFVQQGAVSLDEERIVDEQAAVEADGETRILKVGKRRFARLTVG